MTLLPRPWLAKISPYRAGAHATSADASMASNESPLGASPAVARAVAAAVQDAAHYPDPLADTLRHRLAAFHGVDPDEILIGNGSDELIFLLATAYLAGGGRVVCADPAYRIDEISAHTVNAELIKVPLTKWRHDLDTMSQIESDLTYVVNPHNPTGTLHSRTELERYLGATRAKLTIIDEAYIQFADAPEETTAIPLVRTGGVAVLRTFSKIDGLAGLRVGYLIAPTNVIHTLRTIRAPFSVGSLAQAAAVAALGDRDHRDRVRTHTLQHREQLTRMIESAGYTVIRSQANFVLVLTPNETAFIEQLAAHGITVRPGTALGIPGTVRVSVPSTDGLSLLEAALKTP
jgi:histidinol-phosphate aminotransferase